MAFLPIFLIAFSACASGKQARLIEAELSLCAAMISLVARCSLLIFCLIAAGCASRPLPKYEKPMARAAVQNVRTTAYTHTESDHRKYARNSALGTPLRYGDIKSAAADWSRWPAGTIFRVRETGNLYQVDDYGWALAGTNTIDLYKPSRSAMNQWGVRRVNIEILQWGDAWRSYDILKPRNKHKHVERMIKQIRQRYSKSVPASDAPVAPAVAPGSSQANPFFASHPGTSGL
jgi:3D (Asp-Asp-Asp) domain-containing protein